MNVVGPAALEGPLLVAVNVTVPDVPGVIVGDVTAIATSALAGPVVTDVGLTVLFAAAGSAVVIDELAEPPEMTPGAAEAGTETGTATFVEAPLARLPATVHVTVPDAPDPDGTEQPDGNVPRLTPTGGVYVNVVGPTAVDGPLFVAVIVTVPDVPGVIVGLVTAVEMSAERAPAVTVVEASELLAAAGSFDAVDTEADPPMIAPGAVDDGTDTGMATLVDAPLASVPATVQVTVPEASVHPDGNVPSVTPDGGVYVNVVGPAASDGPPFVAVNVTVPEVPGVIVGDVTAMATSAERTPAVTVVEATELFAVAGSVDAVETEAEPPVIAPGDVDAESETGTATLVDAPLASVPPTVQVTVPEASVHPDGNVPSVTPDGGV